MLDVLSYEALEELEEKLTKILPDKITEILTIVNRTGELEKLLELLRCTDLLNNSYKPYNGGKIIVVGTSEIKEEDILSVGERLGISRDRFECYLDYNSIKRKDFKAMCSSAVYSAILFGPIPHSGRGKGKSLITAIENADGYAKAVRVGSGKELKITHNTIQKALEQLIEKGDIVPDYPISSSSSLLAVS